MALSGDPEMTLCVNYTDKFPADLFPPLIYLHCVWGGWLSCTIQCVLLLDVTKRVVVFSHCIFFYGPDEDLLTIYMLDLPTRA